MVLSILIFFGVFVCPDMQNLPGVRKRENGKNIGLTSLDEILLS